MSPTIPILSALLLLLISESAEGVPKMSPAALLRQTFRYWRKIYNTYYEELALGYCWADYLFRIRNELSTNLSALSLATKGDRSNMTVEATKSQQNPFPQNVMAGAATTQLRETRGGKHLLEKRSHATAGSSISRFANNPDGHRVASSTKIIQEEQRKWMVNQSEQGLPYNMRENNRIGGNKRTTSMIDSYIEKRRHALAIVPELFHNEELKTPRGHEFSSHVTSSRVVNPTPNPEDDDKVDYGSMDQQDARRKVLRPSHRGSFVEGGFGPRSFSLKVSRGRRPRSLDGHRFPFRRWPSSRERNSRVDTPLSDPGMVEEDRGIRIEPIGRRIPLNNDGSSSTSPRSHFRQTNANTESRRKAVVKLMDFEENSSCDPAGTINSKTPYRKLEELSPDSLLSPREKKITVVERSSLGSRRSQREAVKKEASLRFATTEGNDTKKRRYQRMRGGKRSRTGRDVLEAPKTIHSCFCAIERLRRQIYENLGSFHVRRAKGSREVDNLIRTVRSAPLLPRVKLIDDYKSSMIQSAENSKLRNRDQLSRVQSSSFVSNLSSIIIAIFRTLGMFVEVGRQIVDIVESNSALVCTKEYLWTKIIRWLDG